MKKKILSSMGLVNVERRFMNSLKKKGLDSLCKSFCDQRYLEICEYDGKKCFGYDEVKSMGLPFLISPYDSDVFFEIKKQIMEDGNKYYEMNNIADYLGEDKVAFNRDFVAFYHVKNMDNYFDSAEIEENMTRFWSEKSDFYQLFCQLDLTNVIELACGRGRHVKKYIDKATDVTLVDILDKNINICQERFHMYNNIHYYNNNGYNLKELSSDKYTALFSYDAMVHFEMMDIYEYLKDIYRVLIKGGKVLIHHSNYDRDYKVSFIDGPYGRSYMNASIFAYMAFRCGFRILEQKVIPWGIEDLDCISLLEKY